VVVVVVVDDDADADAEDDLYFVDLLLLLSNVREETRVLVLDDSESLEDFEEMDVDFVEERHDTRWHCGVIVDLPAVRADLLDFGVIAVAGELFLGTLVALAVDGITILRLLALLGVTLVFLVVVVVLVGVIW
jgi:hypothetical protein